MEQWLNRQSRRQGPEALQPLEATRTLGERFEVSHGTVFRLFCRMEKDGRVWRHPNGRFYPSVAGRVLGKPQPVGVMLRKMATWSALSREVMEGFTEQCAKHDRPILLFHNKELLVQGTADSQPGIASLPQQKELLRDFFLLHGDAIGGVLFDELWSEEAIRKMLPKKLPAVTFYRPSEISGVGNVAADFRAGARLAINHLIAGGYDEIVLIEPFPDYAPAHGFLTAAQESYRKITGRRLAPEGQIPLFDPASQEAFLHRAATSRVRIGIICPEDNLCQHLAGKLTAAGVTLGRDHGLLSVMGTSALTGKGITCVRYDFRKMGAMAADMLCGQKADQLLVTPSLKVGNTT